MFIKLTNEKTKKPFYVNTDNILYFIEPENTTEDRKTEIIWKSANYTGYTYVTETPDEIRNFIDNETQLQERNKYELLARTLNEYEVFR